MASVSRDNKGWRILFADADGIRRTLRLGKVDRKAAESIRGHVEALLVAKTTAQPMRQETAAWLGSIGEKLRGRLERVGLVEAAPTSPTVCDWVQKYIESRVTVKPTTKDNWRIVRDNLVAFLGDKRLTQVTPADGDRFREYLAGALKLSPATVSKRIQIARQFFRAALRSRLIVENPFADVAAPNVSNRERMRFVTREDTERIITSCPDVHWRTIVALARYGGLRCPSEVLSLRWDGIDWERSRMRVDSPKTEHHPGGAFRIVPIFPELRPFLESSWAEAEEGAVYVIPERFRKGALKAEVWKSCNVRTTFEKIVRRAGVEPWPRLFQNLRSSRETELVEQFPVHVVTRWIGNTPTVAMRHYLQVTDEHYEQALTETHQTTPRNPTQNPTQQLHE